MTHKPQPGADAYALAAENACLARAVTRMAEWLRWIAKADADDQPHRVKAILDTLENERAAIKLAARVWPPTAEQGRG